MTSTEKRETNEAKRQRLLAELATLDASDKENSAEMLARLIHVLIPLDLKRNGTFTVKKSERTPGSTARKIYSYIHSGLSCMKYTTLSEVVFSFRDHMPSGTETEPEVTFRCYLQLINRDRLEFHCHMQPPVDSAVAEWTVEVVNDIDAFETAFHSAARAAHPIYRPAFGTTPAWCYILLAMLACTDHVFDPMSDTAACRMQRVPVDERRAMFDILARFWVRDLDECDWTQCIYPFIVRLMSPEFALSVCEDALELFF